jgi:hypothetical protein
LPHGIFGVEFISSVSGIFVQASIAPREHFKKRSASCNRTTTPRLRAAQVTFYFPSLVGELHSLTRIAPTIPSAFHAHWKAVPANSFFPVAMRQLFGVFMDLSNVQDFLQFCDSIDLSACDGATFKVGPEVTGVIEA